MDFITFLFINQTENWEFKVGEIMEFHNKINSDCVPAYKLNISNGVILQRD